jgi:hypothetical protein
MTEAVTLHKKAAAGTASPEGWLQVGGSRRARIERITDAGALNAGALLNANVTHEAKVASADDYDPAGGGARLIKRARDGQNFLIVRAVTAGREGRNSRTRYMRLSLSMVDGAGV